MPQPTLQRFDSGLFSHTDQRGILLGFVLFNGIKTKSLDSLQPGLFPPRLRSGLLCVRCNRDARKGTRKEGVIFRCQFLFALTMLCF